MVQPSLFQSSSSSKSISILVDYETLLDIIVTEVAFKSTDNSLVLPDECLDNLKSVISYYALDSITNECKLLADFYAYMVGRDFGYDLGLLCKESFDHRNYFFYRVQIDLRATILWVLEPYPFPKYEQHALFPFHDVRDVSFFLRPAHPCCR